MVPVDSLLHHLEQLLAPFALTRGRTRRVPELDPRLARQELHRGHEIEVLGLLDEGEHVALGAAPEAHVAARLVVHVERPGALRMERAETHLAAPRAPELGVRADDVGERDGRTHPLDVVLRDPHAPDTSAGVGHPRAEGYVPTPAFPRSGATPRWTR